MANLSCLGLLQIDQIDNASTFVLSEYTPRLETRPYDFEPDPIPSCPTTPIDNNTFGLPAAQR